ncbi:MAG: phytoene/squalene synthase family protein [Chloroflexota bacterium]|nr:phytoene/squalene synthase family protein [Chloroflexota bacterium]
MTNIIDNAGPVSVPRRSGTAGEDIRMVRAREARSDDWKLCSEVTRTHGRTFYFSSQFMPPHKRRAIHSAYAFCRIADDLVDRAAELGEERARARLQAWEDEIDDPQRPVAIAYAATRETYRIPSRFTHELFSGIRMDLDAERYETWDEFYVYCYRVAGTIGLITSPILGVKTASATAHAVELGVAMQLTNILRDIGEDAAVGRLYLPLRELASFGVDPGSIMAGRPNGDFDSFMAFQIDRAREYYRRANAGIPALAPSGQFAALASSRMYSRILNQIEAQRYDVFGQRAYISTGRKLRQLPVVLTSFVRLNLP